jgi:16S rRNA (cytosine1402-N4)-methyltransferase
VLTVPLMELVAPQAGEIVVDATLGHGGHTSLLVSRVGATGRLIGFDVDPLNLERARERLERALPREARPAWNLIRANFAELGPQLETLEVVGVDVILADLGVTTDQLLDAGIGLTFAEDGPLDMRLDDRLTTTAEDLINRLDEKVLADLIYRHSQERFSRRIAKRICQARRDRRIRRTSELVRLVCQALNVDEHSRKSRIHPATRTFQALRIAVNHEDENLTALLHDAPRWLNPGGRLAVISFHSGEDRLVKKDFLDRRREEVYELVTKKPIVPSSEETRRNPRSRSAKLRVALRTHAPLPATG